MLSIADDANRRCGDDAGQRNNPHLRRCFGSLGLFRPASHCDARAEDESLEPGMCRSHWTASAWGEYLRAGEMESRLAVIRQRTPAGPWGLPSYSKPGEGDEAAADATKARSPRKKSLWTEHKVNSRSILSKLCFSKVQVPIPSDD
jgi:hypothetical protein